MYFATFLKLLTAQRPCASGKGAWAGAAPRRENGRELEGKGAADEVGAPPKKGGRDPVAGVLLPWGCSGAIHQG